MPKLLRRGAVVGAGLAALLATTTGTAAATPTTPRPRSAVTSHVTSSRLVAGAGWLATQFVDASHLPHPDGDHFDSQYGGTYYPDYGLNADVIDGLAAAKTAKAKLGTALGYLRRHVDDYTDISNSDGFGPYDGAVGKLALAAIVAGAHPRSFGGYDLLRQLKKDECIAASTTCPAPGAAANIYSSVSESYVLLAEARGGVGISSRAKAYFASLQCASGGFTSGVTACGSGAADIDSTSYALMAMQAEQAPQSQITRAVHWLRSQQRPAGYWVSQHIANVDSTGLATAALGGLGRPVGSARAWLWSQQVGAGRPGAGAFRYGGAVQPTTTSATSPSVIATAQALLGLAPRGSLALVSAAGARSAAPVFRPVARPATPTVQRGQRTAVRAIGFAAGERLRLTLRDGRLLRRGTAGPLGVARLRYRVPRSLAPGRHVLVVHGVASGLAARHRVRVAGGSATRPATATFTALTTAAPKPTHVGIVIRGKGVRCVAWHKGITGDAILNEVANVEYRPSDGLIVRIDGTPKSGTADDTHFWSYWHDVKGVWHYSNYGASSWQPAAGTVEGWAYDNGSATKPKPTAKAAGLYHSLCGKQDATAARPTPTPSPTPTRTATTAPASSSHPAAHHRPVSVTPAGASASAPAHASRPTRTAVAVSSTRQHKPAAAKRRGRHTRRPAARPRRPAGTSSAAAVAAASRPSPARTLLVKPAAQPTSSGSVAPTLVATAIVVMLLLGGGLAVARRRRTE